MTRQQTPGPDDLDGDRIPDDHDVAEAARDVVDTFRTDNVGRDIGPGGIGATNDDARQPGTPANQPGGRNTRSTNQ